jgi:hypothetical protein
MRFQIDWEVMETINGPSGQGGLHDDGVCDGDRTCAASGSIEKEGENEVALREELIAALKKVFPEHGLGPTYDIIRSYNIRIKEVSP